MPRPADESVPRLLLLLTGTIIGVIVVAALYVVQIVFIPLALSILLTFVLGPLVRLLQKRRVPRIPSVIVVMIFAAGVLGGLGYLIAHQTTSLVEELPNYEANIKAKVASVRAINSGTGRLQELYDELVQTWRDGPKHDQKPERTSDQEPAAPQPKDPESSPPAPAAPAPAVLAPPNVLGSSWLSTLPQILGSAVTLLGGLVFVLALTVFMLLNKEDLRGRFLRLAGRDHLTLTTKAVDEAFNRISRYLVMQLAVNTTYGLVLSIGLTIMGVPHAILWGVLAGIMRYVPYIGAWTVGLLLFVISIAISSTWTLPLMVFGLFLVMELIASNVAEPFLYGKSIGVSQVALLVAAALWAFLWGPIGLVLSGPMTVCLAVLGRYVPQLKFIDVLLGDEPALAPDVSFYQRLLAQDEEEAIDLVLCHAKESSAENVFSTILTPALTYAKRDRARDELQEEDEFFIHRVVREIVRRLQEQHPIAVPGPGDHPMDNVHILACAGQDDGDLLALEMLGLMIGSTRWEYEILSAEMLVSEIVSTAQQKQCGVVLIGSLPPGGLSHARYLSKRLRASLPDVKILVGRWGLRTGVDQNRDELKAVGVDHVATTLEETRDWLRAHFSVLASDTSASPSQPSPKQLAATGA